MPSCTFEWLVIRESMRLKHELASEPLHALIDRLVAKLPGKGVVSPTLVPTVGRWVLTTNVFTGVLRRMVGDIAGGTTHFPGSFSVKVCTLSGHRLRKARSRGGVE